MKWDGSRSPPGWYERQCGRRQPLDRLDAVLHVVQRVGRTQLRHVRGEGEDLDPDLKLLSPCCPAGGAHPAETREGGDGV